jgi:hypothetical protein
VLSAALCCAVLCCAAGCRFYGLDGSQVTVEQLALQHYASEEGGGWQGLHCEGGVWAALFGLLLWDVLFMSEWGCCGVAFVQTADLTCRHVMCADS